MILCGIGLRALSTLVAGADLNAVRGLAGDRSATSTALAHAASWLGRSHVLVPCAGVVGIWAIAAGRRAEGLTVIAGMLGAVIIQNVDKAIIGRPRPPVPELEHVSGTSFPSGHATEATAFFLLMLVAIPPGAWSRCPVRWVAIIAVAAAITCVALSRVYLGVHYPTDVAAGILLGAAWSALTARILLAPVAA